MQTCAFILEFDIIECIHVHVYLVIISFNHSAAKRVAWIVEVMNSIKSERNDGVYWTL